MFRVGSFILRLVLALVLLAGVIGAVAFAFRAGYSQGYVIGAANAGDGAQPAPNFPVYPGRMPHYGFYGMHFFPPIGMFFCGSLLFVVLIGAIFRPRHWHRHHDWTGHPHGPWAHRWAHEHPCGPENAPDHTSEERPEPKAPEAS
jgi:hypothetical protein